VKLDEHIYYGDLRVEFFVKKSRHFKMCFCDKGIICTREPS
jgi:hypothetical protein